MFDMKKLAVAAAICALAALPCAAQELPQAPQPTYAPGEYTAQAKGYGGYVFATVTIDEAGAIAQVVLKGDSETPYVGGYALEDMPQWFIDAQSTEVDAYSGATFTRDAAVEAVQAALDQAAQ